MYSINKRLKPGRNDFDRQLASWIDHECWGETSFGDRHYKWLPWTGANCTKEAYIGLGQGYTGFEWKKAFKPYDPEHPKLAQFLAEGMRVFAERELS